MFQFFLPLSRIYLKFHATNGIETRVPELSEDISWWFTGTSCRTGNIPGVGGSRKRTREEGRRGEGGTRQPPLDVNHPPLPLPLLSTGGRAKWMGKPRTSLFPKNNSDEPAFPLKSLIRGFVVGIPNLTEKGKFVVHLGGVRWRRAGRLFGHFSKSVLSFVSVMLRACCEVYFRLKFWNFRGSAHRGHIGWWRQKREIARHVFLRWTKSKYTRERGRN